MYKHIFKFVWLLAISLFYNQELRAQASVVTGSVTTSKNNYVVGQGKNRVIVVAVTGEVGTGPIGTITGITWGGQSLTQARAQTSPVATPVLRTDIWYLNEAGISAARGSCNYNFVVTWSSAPTNEVFAAFTLKDVDQATPVANVNSAQSGAATTRNTGNIGVGVNDILVYASSSDNSRTHTPPGTYTERTDQAIGGAGGTSMATATRSITAAGNENPTATWATGNSRLINVGVGFNGVAATDLVTYYSRNATSGGHWDDRNSWTLSSDGTGGPLPAGVWPTRTDHVVIRAGHTIIVNATDDNKRCGVSPDGLSQSNIGPFVSSNIPMFYHTGDITIAGTLSVTGIEMMTGGYTHILSSGSFNLGSNLVQTGYLEADAGSAFSSLDDLVLTGNSVSIINTNSTSTDDLIIDHTDATLCGTGTATLQNGAGSQVTYANGGSINQICTSFTINCTGGGCTGFPVVGTTPVLVGNAGPAGVGNATNNKLWLMAGRGAFSDLGVTAAVNTGTVRQWNDQSGNGNHALQNTAGNRPIFSTGQDNAQAALEFTGDLFIDGPSLGIAGNSSATYMMVFRDTQTGLGGINDGNGHFILDRTTATNGLFSLKPITGNVYAFQKRDDGGGGLGGPASTTTVNTNSKWIEMVRNRGVNYRLYYNGVQEASVADGDGNTTPPAPRIGRHATTTNGGLRGLIYEFIIYSATLNEAQRILMNNYISAKYGYTLSANDVYTMDNVANGNFDFEVAGIGQAGDGSRHIDAKGTGAVRMWNPSGLANGEFLVWGHNGLAFSGGNTSVDGVIIQERLNRVWRVSEAGDVGTVSISVDLAGTLGSALGSNLRLLIDRDGDGFADNDVTPIAGSFTGTVVTFSGVNFQNGDRFTIGNTNILAPLPIELISFTAEVVQNEVLLQWSTASEKNNDYFTIQRSQSAEVWEDIATRKGAGNSQVRKDYQLTDGMPYAGVSYYRIMQTDFDGTYTFSQVKRVQVEAGYQLKAWPNPTSGKLTVVTGFKLESQDIRLINTVGQTVPVEVFRAGAEAELDMQSLPPGIYFLQVRKGFWQQSLRIVVD
ncbi:MAG: T9SS type A sorting domain-containing protein [Cyclobacteriaceae bacterium]|nr:T9SS type A sorting domain-containing protein [Cyclobacteriaceae bacterium]